MASCNTKTCGDDATHRAHWATGPIELCAHCALKWKRIGEALGLTVHIERLDVAKLAATLMADDE